MTQKSLIKEAKRITLMYGFRTSDNRGTIHFNHRYNVGHKVNEEMWIIGSEVIGSKFYWVQSNEYKRLPANLPFEKGDTFAGWLENYHREFGT